MNTNDFRGYFDILPIAFTVIELVLDGDGRPLDFIFRYANRALAELEEAPLESLLDKRFYRDVFTAQNDRKWLPFYHASAYRGETHELHEYSPEINKHLKITSFPWLEPGHCACILTDETALTQARRQLEQLALVDETTRFGNRNAYIKYFTQFRPGRRVGVIFVDVNGLKATNDQYGHLAGDALIQMVRDRINRIFDPQENPVFRIGGDEFVVILPDVERDVCGARAEQLRDGLRNENLAHMPGVLASVGWSWAAKPDSLEDVVHDADASMYRCKDQYHGRLP